MRTDIPTGIQTSAFSLNPEGLVKLYVLSLASGAIFRMTNEASVTWQGYTYESIPCALSEFRVEAEGKANRPNFSFANPEGIFTAAVGQGLLDNATLKRYTLLKADLDADNDFAIEETLRVSQVLSVVRGVIVTQLRDVHDAQSYTLPARAFYPPEFPHVKL